MWAVSKFQKFSPDREVSTIFRSLGCLTNPSSSLFFRLTHNSDDTSGSCSKSLSNSHLEIPMSLYL
jgi:hypothetical protein